MLKTNKLLIPFATIALSLLPSIAYAHGYDGLYGAITGILSSAMAIHVIGLFLAIRKLKRTNATSMSGWTILLILIAFLLIGCALMACGLFGIIIGIAFLIVIFFCRDSNISHQNSSSRPERLLKICCICEIILILQEFLVSMISDTELKYYLTF
ncbi:MAG: hypothetical protein J6A01_10560, partial [Proteobacteria bacterium]|nr:hypothetical protein [Pseudomonadota bacterium]